MAVSRRARGPYAEVPGELRVCKSAPMLMTKLPEYISQGEIDKIAKPGPLALNKCPRAGFPCPGSAGPSSGGGGVSVHGAGFSGCGAEFPALAAGNPALPRREVPPRGREIRHPGRTPPLGAENPGLVPCRCSSTDIFAFFVASIRRGPVGSYSALRAISVIRAMQLVSPLSGLTACAFVPDFVPAFSSLFTSGCSIVLPAPGPGFGDCFGPALAVRLL